MVQTCAQRRRLDGKFNAENSICAAGDCGYVGDMNWQQFLPLFIVLVVAVIFVWRGSGGKKTGCGSNCGCSHDHGSKKSA
jgi:hypothetical protein